MQAPKVLSLRANTTIKMVIPLTAVDIALPTVTTLRQCAEYSKTFEPFLPQLYALPNQLYAALGDIEALKHIYVSTNPAIFGLAVCIALSPIFLIASEINKNYSQVDRVWSILPTVFNFHYALWARLNGLSTKRVDHVLAFSVIWSIRLTYNYWRKGGYQIGSEDYRWELIKKQIGSFGFFMLNILFISSAQIVSVLFMQQFRLLTRVRFFSGASPCQHTCSCSLHSSSLR